MMRLSCVCVFLVITLSLVVQGHRSNNNIRFLHEDQCGSVVRIDCLNNSRRVPRSVHGQSRPSGPVCAQLTENQLVKKLKDIGGYNPLYVAINESEAKNFKDPRTFEMTKETKKPRPTRVKDCKNSPTPTTTTPPTTQEQSTTPPTSSKQTTTPPVPTTRSQHFHHYEINEKSFKRQRKRFFPLETLLKRLKDINPENIRHRVKRATRVVKEDCWTKGGNVSGSNPKRLHLCSECKVTTKLPGDTFPPYINEAACGFTFPVQSGTASEDNKCYASSGLCIQKVIKMPALKRTGYVRDEYLSARFGYDVYTERWITWYKDIRASCQCQIYLGHAAALKAIQGSL